MAGTLSANDADAGCWWWWTVPCVNPGCLFSATRFYPPMPIMVTTRYVGQDNGCTVLDVTIDGSARFVLRLASTHGTSAASKPVLPIRAIASGRMPTWNGIHCPQCRAVVQAAPLMAVDDERALCTQPHLCVTAVAVNGGEMQLRLDSPTMLDFWLQWTLPASLLPVPVDNVQ